jgi:hypothetical protein
MRTQASLCISTYVETGRLNIQEFLKLFLRGSKRHLKEVNTLPVLWYLRTPLLAVLILYLFVM